jgi:cell shape-determining protein MreC
MIFQVMKEYSSLQNFWKRYNKVLLDKLSLDREKEILEDENSKLKVLLKQYLDGKETLPMHKVVAWHKASKGNS